MRLFIRTEASPQIGMGHFMRCFAIAEEARARGVDVTFLVNDPESVAGRLAEINARGIRVEGGLGSATDFMALGELGLSRRDWLVIDSYTATEDYVALQSQVARVAVLDDLNALAHFDCDLLINPAMAARHSDYERKTSAKLLLGADYALIRREFRHAPATGRSGGIVVMFGGSDPTRLTETCVRRISEALPETRIAAIAGPANVHTDELIQLERKLYNMQIQVAPGSVSGVLTNSDLVITAAGGSVGEIAAMGLPALVLVVYDNQVAALKACPFPVIDARAGLPDDLGARIKTLMGDPDERQKIAASAHAVVDGKGPQRIVEAMRRV